MRPGIDRAKSGVVYSRTRETVRSTNRAPGIMALGVLLLAALIFAGGTLALFVSPPGDPLPTLPAVANRATPSHTIAIFEQITPTPVPTPTPLITVAPIDTGSPGLTIPPSGLATATPTFPTTTTPPDRTPRPTCNANGNPPGCRPTEAPNATPTRTPRPATATPRPPTATPTDPGPAAPSANFSCSQIGQSTEAECSENASGQINQYSWSANHGGGPASGPNARFNFNGYGTHRVTLTVTGPGGSDSRTKNVTLTDPSTPPPSQSNPPSPTCGDPEPPCEPPGESTPTASALLGGVDLAAIVLFALAGAFGSIGFRKRHP